MATKIVTKNSSTASAVPTASDLVQGELAVNVADKRLFTEDNTGTIVELGTNPSTIDINAGSIDGTAIGASSASTGAFTTLTATGLTVDTDTLYVDSTNNRVGIGTTSPLRTLHLKEAVPSIRLEDTDVSGVYHEIISEANTGYCIRVDEGNVSSGSYFRVDIDNSEKMRIDSSGNVGIGTTSPSKTLVVNENDSECVAIIKSSDTGTAGLFLGGQTDEIKGGIVFNNSDNSLQLRGYNNAERARIDSSGNVGIGTTSPSVPVHVYKSQASPTIVAKFENPADEAIVEIKSKNTDLGVLQFADTEDANVGTVQYSHSDNSMRFKTNDSERMRIDSSGNVGIDCTNPDDGNLQIGDTNSSFNISIAGVRAKFGYDGANAIVQGGSTKGIAFCVDNNTFGSGEAMRIDSSGNLLVGKSSSAFGTDGIQLNVDQLWVTNTSSSCMSLNRKGTSGAILNFYDDGSLVGSIGTINNDITVGTGDTGLRFVDSLDAIWAVNSTSGASRDNAIDLGQSSIRFDDIYATNGTIQTSDRNEKQDIAELSEAEQRVAVACKGLLRKFRWKDSVAEKGDDARIHFGIIAQDLQAAFEAEGLDAGDYAMFISTTWTDEETNEEKTRMGVRYSELLAFIISAI